VRARIRRVAVVIPAHDEAAVLGECLSSVLAACSAARSARVGDQLSTDVIVVLDRCTDDSAAVVRQYRSVGAHAVAIGRVGAVRDYGVRASLSGSDGIPPDQVLVMSTDADSRVPHNWVAAHVSLIEAGADVVLGTVLPNPQGLSRTVGDEWRRRHFIADGHPHVHGANLSVRADVYLALGGFADLEAHEDVAFAELALAHGAAIVATGGASVITSSRLVGRAPRGFADYLRDLDTTLR
jgi:glycosyltransferase involved in cell wall biosynthesis